MNGTDIILKDFVFMERYIRRSSFLKIEKSDSSVSHIVVFAIKQSNIDQLESILMEISSPGNSRYQKWLTFDEVGNLTQNTNSYQIVKKWLDENNIEIMWKSRYNQYIKAKASIEKWSILLNTVFYKWKDQTKYNTKYSIYNRAETYYLPNGFDKHISAVFNTVQTPIPLNPKYHIKNDDIPFKSAFRLKKESKLLQGGLDGTVTVALLNDFYNIKSNIGNKKLNQAVFETASEYFSPKDLESFQKYYNLTKQPAVDRNGFSSDKCTLDGSIDCFEGNLDIQYLMGISQMTTSIYWYVPPTGDPFVDWIIDVANDPHPPQSNSISWGAFEMTVPSSEKDAFNTEALKLSVMGVTIVVSSGDDGAAGKNYNYLTDSCMCLNKAYGYTGYNPFFPATSPYVTTVGATMGPEFGKSEIACQSQLGGIITSGGGFSSYFSQPKWQTSAVNNYFSVISKPPVDGYNRQGRGYPDVSLIGAAYQVVVGGNIYSVYGTSCSAPVFAAMISLVNSVRYNNNQPSVGFINPTLYRYSSNFNDINTSATCCSTGFTATNGWDPVTGLGSINFDQLTFMFKNNINLNSPTRSPTQRERPDGVASGLIIGFYLIMSLVLVGTAFRRERNILLKNNGKV